MITTGQNNIKYYVKHKQCLNIHTCFALLSDVSWRTPRDAGAIKVKAVFQI